LLRSALILIRKITRGGWIATPMLPQVGRGQSGLWLICIRTEVPFSHIGVRYFCLLISIKSTGQSLLEMPLCSSISKNISKESRFQMSGLQRTGDFK
jgi:hypothetical protein